MFKRLFVIFAGLALVASSLAPVTVLASSYDGHVIKRQGHSTLYYVGADGQRYVFPNGKTYDTWFSDYSNITELNDSQLATMPLAGNVTYRPGVILVKIDTDPKVYAVAQDGTLRWVTSEALAQKLYGDNWNLLIDDIPDAFFANYKIGQRIDDDNDFDADEEAEDNDTFDHNHGLALGHSFGRRSDTTKCRAIPAQPAIPHGPDKRPAIPAISARVCKLNQNVDTAAPVISNVTMVISANLATIGWKTNENSDSKVWYSSTSPVSLVSSTPSVINASLVTNHSLALTGLNNSTTYYFIIQSRDTHGNTAISSQQSFTTGTTVDNTAPIISAIAAAPTVTGATITWTTNESSNSKVWYSTSSPVSLVTSTPSVVNASLVTSHSLNLTGLTASTTYYYIVQSADGSGNTATSSQHSFVTSPDVTAPIISAITATPTSTSSLIGWTTNEPSSSEVQYATSTLATATNILVSSNATLVTSHSVNLLGLQASTTYYFLVKSVDAASNMATSSQQTFLTLP